ncbi:hypothetical protein [Megasphaera cerevisiae]|uniref:hypothetical protein n=1 Tax=Megasphaera cerevisiae TaxID=39029 RepID=UPI00117C8F48|nr:hypothetical protein [Megasphaera cerevisiae]
MASNSAFSTAISSFKSATCFCVSLDSSMTGGVSDPCPMPKVTPKFAAVLLPLPKECDAPRDRRTALLGR